MLFAQVAAVSRLLANWIGACSALILFGCASADLVIRDDKSPSPLDTNYNTIVYETVCNGETKITLGQAVCSLDFDADLSKHSISVLSPLGGSLTIYSRTAGVDERIFLDKGEKITFTLDKLVPKRVEYATYSFQSFWEKPDTVKTEVPVRGQQGLFYFRLRPKNVPASMLSWAPNGGSVQKAGFGIIAAQFRALGGVQKLPLMEPIMLEIKTTQSVGDGRYQLYNAQKEIGIKIAPFAGDEILVPRDTILGTAKENIDYSLFGWARDESLNLDNDFIVAISLYDSKTMKLSASLSFKEAEVCFKTEAAVSLVMISGVEKASNKVEDCFPKPNTPKAWMFFYTNVGRSAFAEIDTISNTYELHQ